jgi:hypothetical protein
VLKAVSVIVGVRATKRVAAKRNHLSIISKSPVMPSSEALPMILQPKSSQILVPERAIVVEGLNLNLFGFQAITLSRFLLLVPNYRLTVTVKMAQYAL